VTQPARRAQISRSSEHERGRTRSDERNTTVASADDVKKLRELTNAGVMDCKRALDEAGGDIDKAVQVLREKGIASAEKRSGRTTGQGLVESYIHAGGRIGVLVEVNCETDFVARTDDFKRLAHDIAMQIAGVPTTLAITEEELPDDAEGSPEETVLLKQPFIRDGSRTIEALVKELIAQTGENIQIRRFSRFELGQ
jgi:elongation factor Ts